MASRSASFSHTSTPLKLNSLEKQNSSPSVWFLAHRSLISPTLSNSIPRRRVLSHDSVASGEQKKKKKSCACSPSTHPGSFRCSLHRPKKKTETASSMHTSGSLKLWMLAIKNSLVKMGKDSEAEKISLKDPVRHTFQRRREASVPRRSPLSRMSEADDSCRRLHSVSRSAS